MSTDLHALTPEQLAAQAAQGHAEAKAAQSELERRQNEKMLADTRAQREEAQRVLATWRDIDARLRSEGLAGERAGLAAMHARDITAAISGWISYRASRYARNVVRDAAIGAHNILGTDPHGIIDLRLYTADLAGWLGEHAEKVAREDGYDAGRAAIGLVD